MTRFTLKNDRYAKSRGGNSHFLDLHCSKCNEHIAVYQKDGRGSLLRLYLDRIFAPENLASLQSVTSSKSALPRLCCTRCGQLVGVPMIYERENRLAFRLIQGSFLRKKNQ